ncbi:MAG: single-stranded-DNA-specific exonuclease RecJ [Ottowia sp.]|nr:single-stranded-DNA-specific exonuclease RecJ [Ottowia sp.]
MFLTASTDNSPRIVTRDFSLAHAAQLIAQGIDPVLARIFAARGIEHATQLETELSQLLPPTQLRNNEQAAILLADALSAEQKILVIADYDCDGATACAVAVRGLRLLAKACGKSAKIDYLVPNRFEYGYGLTPEIVALAALRKPDLLVTVDNGIASVDGVAAAKNLGIAVLITDHHLPGNTLPDAHCIVNPNQPKCTFQSKHLAGVGVMFYVLLALRAELRARNAFNTPSQPRLDSLLDLVALGTIADVVVLDHNNRILVAQGLKRIRSRAMQPGIAALLQVAGREAAHLHASDLGFAIGPRINAAGRLADMSLGIECLLSENFDQALAIATQLDAINRERRVIEADMQEHALNLLKDFSAKETLTLCTFSPDWHQGVIGILASRLRERFHRPTIAFALGGDGIIKGSGRSIPGFHLRDALDHVSKRHPHLIQKFGGHAMAAGLTLAATDLDRFTQAFEEVAQTDLDPSHLNRICATDGALTHAALNSSFVTQLAQHVWGQGFPPPIFEGIFDVAQQNLLKDKHLKLVLTQQGQRIQGIWFNHTQPLPTRVRIAYRLELNRYNGNEQIQLLVEQADPT